MTTKTKSRAKSKPKSKPKSVESLLPERLRDHIKDIDSDIRTKIIEDVVLALLSKGKLDLFEAAEILGCDPDDLLTPEEEAMVRQGEADIAAGRVYNWEDVKKRLKF